MDYKNLLTRLFTSFFLLSFFFIIIHYFNSMLSLVLIFIYGIIFFEVFYSFRKNLNIFIFLCFYLLFSLICIEVYLINYYDKKIFIFFVFIIIFFDTSSYVLGSFFGNKKLLPKISPNKTIFGFFSGIIFALILSLFYNLFFEIFYIIKALIFAIVIIISAFVGDLIESFCKRCVKIKNSSNFLPGHGGIFDRLDSFIMCSITILILSHIYE